MQRLQQKMTSGKEVSRPSDSPTDAVAAMQFRSDRKRTEQYGRNAQDALGLLGAADTTLTNSLESVGRIRELVLLGANATSGPSERTAIAQEIKTIREGLVGLANTTYLNRPIFAGTAEPGALIPAQGAYDASGTYYGNSGPGSEVFRTVGPGGAKVQVNMAGPDVFGTGGTSLFQVLSDIETRLRSGTDADIQTMITTDLNNLDARRLNVLNKLAEVGARYNRVETMKTKAEDDLLQISNSLSQAEDIDLPKTIVDIQLQEVSYRAALSTTAKVIQPSLVDFLR